MVDHTRLELRKAADRILDVMIQVTDLSFKPHMITNGSISLPLFPPTKDLVELARLLAETCSTAQSTGVPGGK